MRYFQVGISEWKQAQNPAGVVGLDSKKNWRIHPQNFRNTNFLQERFITS